MTQRLARRAEDRFITTLRSLEALTARPARRVDGDAMSGDRIKNGHGQPPHVQASSKRRTPNISQFLLKLWLQDSYRSG